MNPLDFTSSLWPVLTRATVHGSIALIAVFVICRLFPRIPAAAKCWLWRLAWLRVILAFATGATLSLPLLPAPTPHAVQGSPMGITRAVAPPEITPSATVAPVTATPTVNSRDAAVLIWALGVVLMAVRLAFHLAAAIGLRRNSKQGASDLLIPLSADFKVRAPMLLISDYITKPLLTGIFRPAIILPAALKNGEARTLELIFKHELAHLKRRDLAWNWLVAIAHTLFWFNPLTWLCEREANFNQEVACDQLALRDQTSRAPEFASLLIDIAANRDRTPQLSTVSIIRTRNTLERRLKAMKPLHQKGSFISIALAAVVLAPAIVPWRAVAQKSDEPTATPQEPKPESAATNTVTEEELLAEEIKLATKELNATARARESGNAGFADVVQRQRELLRLERELGMLRKDATKVRKTLRDELLAVEALQKQAARQVEAGVMSSNEKLKIDREALQLKRELAALDRNEPQAEASGAGAPNMSMMYYMSNPELMKRYFPQMYAMMMKSGQTNWVQTGASGAKKTVATTHDELRAAKDELALLQLKYTDQHPEVIEAKNRIAMLEKSGASAQSSFQARLNAEAAPARIALRPKRAGVVTEVLVDRGDRVNVGTALVRLDNREAQLRLRAAESEYQIARADIELQRKAVEIEQKGIKDGPASVEGKNHLEEVVALKLRRLNHQLELAETKVEQAKLDYEDLTIRAPAAGAIGFVPIIGQTVAPENQLVEFLPDPVKEKGEKP